MNTLKTLLFTCIFVLFFSLLAFVMCKSQQDNQNYDKTDAEKCLKPFSGYYTKS